MKIGILGSGMVAQVLAKGALSKGMQVSLGSRTPEKLKDFAGANAGIETGTFAETAAFGKIVILAVKGIAAEAVVKTLAKEIEGKIVINVANPIDDSQPPNDGILKFFDLQGNVSLIEHLQSLVPKANFG